MALLALRPNSTINSVIEFVLYYGLIAILVKFHLRSTSAKLVFKIGVQVTVITL